MFNLQLDASERASQSAARIDSKSVYISATNLSAQMQDRKYCHEKAETRVMNRAEQRLRYTPKSRTIDYSIEGTVPRVQPKVGCDGLHSDEIGDL